MGDISQRRDEMRFGGGREEEDVMIVVEEEEDEEGSGVARWDRFLPRVGLRVLLVEGDDATRQIISALLRKCNYRVAAVSDGSKAWDMLIEKPHSIDLVLTEVELPSASGFSLLTKVMDHEKCKNIPVIMMSSHDSMSMVFKCMLKGAADFLVKPIRKNELRNLWQHVWRRHSLTSHCGKPAKENVKDNSEKGNHSSEHVATTQNNKDSSEKGSSAQSSCTRSDMEAESTYMQCLELKKPMGRGSSPLDGATAQSGRRQIHFDEIDRSSFNGACMLNERITEDDRSCALVMNEDMKPMGENLNIINETNGQHCDGDKPLKKVIDLIGVIDSQPRCNPALNESIDVRYSLSTAPEVVYPTKDVECKSSPMPLLELSLLRYQQTNCDNQQTDERNTINHSNSSAFSLYNGRTAVPTLLPPMSFQTEGEESFSTCNKSIPDRASSHASSDSRWDTNTEETKSLGVAPPTQDGMAVKCSPVRVIPLPIPIRGVTFDSSSSGYARIMQPIFYQHSTHHPLWSSIPSMWQESVPINSVHQSDTRDLNSLPSHHLGDQTLKNLVPHPAQKDEVAMDLKDGGSSNICNGSASHLKTSRCGSICDGSNGNILAANASKATPEIANEEGKKPSDFHCLNPREAALNKFRLKRKDRCYEKKVRYQSRKRLAEQRPRVKGQFVRQVQLDAHSMDSFPTEGVVK